MNFLLPGDWVFDSITNHVGIIKSSGEKNSLVFLSREGTATQIPNDHLKLLTGPSVVFEYTNRPEIKYLAERRKRMQNTLGGSVVDSDPITEVSPEFERLYGNW